MDKCVYQHHSMARMQIKYQYSAEMGLGVKYICVVIYIRITTDNKRMGTGDA